MTKQNADNADQAKKLSGSAREAADKGSSSMEQMTDAINRIKTSSDETAKIVKTIDEIAFQTNLLALNAAVSQMDQVTRQNVSNSEESASAVEELNSQAEELQRMVGEFNLSRNNGSSTTNRSKSTVSSAPAAVPATQTAKPSNRIHQLVTQKQTAAGSNGNTKSAEADSPGRR